MKYSRVSQLHWSVKWSHYKTKHCTAAAQELHSLAGCWQPSLAQSRNAALRAGNVSDCPWPCQGSAAQHSSHSEGQQDRRGSQGSSWPGQAGTGGLGKGASRKHWCNRKRRERKKTGQWGLSMCGTRLGLSPQKIKTLQLLEHRFPVQTAVRAALFAECHTEGGHGLPLCSGRDSAAPWVCKFASSVTIFFLKTPKQHPPTPVHTHTHTSWVSSVLRSTSKPSKYESCICSSWCYNLWNDRISSSIWIECFKTWKKNLILLEKHLLKQEGMVSIPLKYF